MGTVCRWEEGRPVLQSREGGAGPLPTQEVGVGREEMLGGASSRADPAARPR